MPYKKVPKTIQPAEAKAIASEVNRLAQNVHDISRQVKQAGRELDRTWYGKAKTNFFSRFALVPGKINRLSRSLKGKARQLRVLTIVIIVREWYEDLLKGKEYK